MSENGTSRPSGRSDSRDEVSHKCPPSTVITLDERIGFRAPPLAGLVLRQVGDRVRLPSLVDRRDQRPRRLDEIVAGEQRRVAEQGVEQQRLVRFRNRTAERGAVPEAHHDRRELHARRRQLGLEADRDAFVGLHVDDEEVGRDRRLADPLEDLQRRPAELDRDFCRALREPLAGTQVERHTGPAPAVELHPQRDERLGRRSRRHPLLLAVRRHLGPGHPAATILRPHDVLIPERLNRQQRIHLAVADTLGRECNRRLHRDQGQQLHQVVLDHVAQCAGTFVVCGAALDTDGLRRRDLHVIDVPPVPDRLEHAVRETEDHQVLDGLLPEIVVDPEHLFLVEVTMDEAVQRHGRCAGPSQTVFR